MSMSSGGKAPLRIEGFGKRAAVADLVDDLVELAAQRAVLGGIAGEFEGAQQRQAVADEVGHGFEELDVEAAGDDRGR